MAIVKWAKGIDFVSGLLSKRPKKGTPHSEHSNALLATHRVAETTSPDCNRLYLRKKIKRRTMPSNDEIAARDKFAAVSRMVVARSKSLSTLSSDQAAYAAQKELSGGKTTWKSYLWSVCKAAYEAEQG